MEKAEMADSVYSYCYWVFEHYCYLLLIEPLRMIDISIETIASHCWLSTALSYLIKGPVLLLIFGKLVLRFLLIRYYISWALHNAVLLLYNFWEFWHAVLLFRVVFLLDSSVYAFYLVQSTLDCPSCILNWLKIPTPCKIPFSSRTSTIAINELEVYNCYQPFLALLLLLLLRTMNLFRLLLLLVLLWGLP